jgi:DNA-binding transcriptional LysR family regulator
MIVIGTLELLANRDLSRPESLTDLPWLQELGTNEAAEWFTLHGVVPENYLNVTQMPGNLIMASVRRGDGITYTARAFFQEDIAKGRMQVLFSEKKFGLYYIETQPEPLRPNVKTFVDWLQSKSETISA